MVSEMMYAYKQKSTLEQDYHHWLCRHTQAYTYICIHIFIHGIVIGSRETSEIQNKRTANSLSLFHFLSPLFGHLFVFLGSALAWSHCRLFIESESNFVETLFFHFVHYYKPPGVSQYGYWLWSWYFIVGQCILPLGRGVNSWSCCFLL